MPTVKAGGRGRVDGGYRGVAHDAGISGDTGGKERIVGLGAALVGVSQKPKCALPKAPESPTPVLRPPTPGGIRGNALLDLEPGLQADAQILGTFEADTGKSWNSPVTTGMSAAGVVEPPAWTCSKSMFRRP